MPPKPPQSKPKGKLLTKPPGSKIAKPGTPERPAKKFTVAPWTGDGEGEKIVLYGRSGIGKSTLATMAPTPVFFGIDDGGRRISNPLTGQPILRVPEIETFQDIRDALHTKAVQDAGESFVLDTITKVDPLMQQWVVDNVPSSDGRRVTNFRKFGWDGDRHVLDCYRLLMADFDELVRRGKNIIILAQQGQIRVANAEGADYLEDGPFCQHRNDTSAREELKQWADHVMRIGYLSLEVELDTKSKKGIGKVTSDDTTRAIFTAGAQHFTAKTRPIRGRRLPPIISFESEADDSLWQYVFGDALDNQETE